MSSPSLSLGAGIVAGAGRSGDTSLDKSTVDKTLKRDSFGCRFCGFTSQKFQRVVELPVEGEKPDFLTACTFCEQVLWPDRGALAGAGILVWLPEMTQVDLNHLIRAVYIAREGEGALADAAVRALDIVMARRSEAKKRLGTDDPLALATVLMESLGKDERKSALKKLEGVRLVPVDKCVVRTSAGLTNQFPRMVEYWASADEAFGKVPPTRWGEILQGVNAQ